MRNLLASALFLPPPAARAETGADRLVPMLPPQLIFDGIAITKGGRSFLPFQREMPGQGFGIGERVVGRPKLDAVRLPTVAHKLAIGAAPLRR